MTVTASLGHAGLAVLLLLAAPARGEEPSACAASPLLVGQCSTVHGRLTICNGVPNARIWIVGTKRVLGVEDEKGNPAGDRLLPGQLEEQVRGSAPCSKAAFGDFTICPLTPNRPGVMQRVCVTQAAKIRIRDW